MGGCPGAESNRKPGLWPLAQKAIPHMVLDEWVTTPSSQTSSLSMTQSQPTLPGVAHRLDSKAWVLRLRCVMDDCGELTGSGRGRKGRLRGACAKPCYGF